MTRLASVWTYLSIVFSLLTCSNLYECEHFRDYLSHEAHGTVTNKYLDNANHMTPTITYQTITGKKGLDNQTAMYIPAVYDTIEVGDILDKDPGSTIVTVTKRGSIIELDTAKETRRIWCQR
jgi:hypothetical protein